MLRNYLKIALRNLVKDRVYSFINIAGLALGMMSVLLILFYVQNEMSYDKFFKNHDRIHRIAIDIKTQDNQNLLFAPVTSMLPEALKEYPQVEQTTRIFPSGSRRISSSPEKVFYETTFTWADPNVFDVFSFQFLKGDPQTALDAPLKMVITRSMAEKYFGILDVVGKTLKVNDIDYQITGVIENQPVNSHFQVGFLASLTEHYTKEWFPNWHATMFYTYVKLKPGTDAKAFEQQIHNVADKYVGKELQQNSQAYRFFLQPLTSIHLHSDLRYELGKNNSYRQIQVLTAIAAIILIIACFNFINLATARATRRAKEVGIRKAVGSQRKHLIFQFLLESLLLCAIAMALALVGMWLVLPWFNEITDKQLTLNVLQQPVVWISGLGILLVVGLLAGSYPALVLSGFRPQEVLKGQVLGKSGSQWLRNQLVTAQFAISIALIVATMVVVKQLQYMQQQDLGFSKEQLLVLQVQGGFFKKDYQTVKNELLKNPFVTSVSASANIPGREIGNNLITLKSDQTKSTDTRIFGADEDFFKTYQIELLAGRGFEPTSVDSLGDNVLINEAALPFFGWKKPEEALGATFGGGWGTVVGIVKDFNYTSLQTDIAPMLLYYSPRNFGFFTLKMSTNNYRSALTQLQEQWKAIAPTLPFEYTFLDEDFDKQYQSEMRLSRLFTYFSSFAIFIACLGLFGLSAYVAERRTKEIGIRKVLGASIHSILLLLSKDFIIMVSIAFAIAVPLAWWAMRIWLEDFAYRIDIQWWMFVLAGMAALGIALLTISFQAIRAAVVNPVHALKNE